MKVFIDYVQKNEKLILLSCYLLFIGLIFIGIISHEPWRDEAHAWVHARDNSVVGIIHDARYEGVPILWYMVLAPFAKIGMPYQAMSYVHAFIISAAVALVLFKGKIPLVLKILILFSYYVAFEYAIVARYYALSFLLLCILAHLYNHRFEKPLSFAVILLLLAQTNVHSFGLSAVLSFVFCLQYLSKQKISPIRFSPVIVIVVGLLLTVLYLLPDSSSVSYDTQAPVNPNLEIYNVLRNSFVPSLPSGYLENIILYNSIIVMSVLIFIFLYILLLRRPIILLQALLMLVWIWFINIFIHSGTLRHHGISFIVVIFIIWISNLEKKQRINLEKIVGRFFIFTLSILLVLSSLYTIHIYNAEINSSFSASQDVAQYIQENNLSSYKLVTFYSAHGEAVVAYLPNTPYWYSEFTTEGYFNVADQRYRVLVNSTTIVNVLDKVENHLQNSDQYLLLLTEPIPAEFANKYILLTSSQAKYFWSNGTEDFWLYKITQ